MSLAVEGRLHRHLSEESLHKLLLNHIRPEVRGTSPLTPLLKGLGRRNAE